MTKVTETQHKYVGDKILNRVARFIDLTPLRWNKDSTRPTPSVVRVLADNPSVLLGAKKWLTFMSERGYDAEIHHRSVRVEGFTCKVIVLTATSPLTHP